MEIPRKNFRWNCGLTRSNFREFIGSFIISACNMVELEAVKLILKVPYLLAVGLHFGVTAA
jgi:hypothetical protein